MDSRSDLFGQFNFNDFKKWMNTQKDNKSKTNYVGLQIESKVSLKKFSTRIEVENGDIDDIMEDFKNDGGTIVSVEGNKFLVEVESGSFIVHKMYTKKKS